MASSNNSLVLRSLLNQRLRLTRSLRRWWSSLVVPPWGVSLDMDLCGLVPRQWRACCPCSTYCSKGLVWSGQILRNSFELISALSWGTLRRLAPVAQQIIPRRSFAYGKIWNSDRTGSQLSHYEFSPISFENVFQRHNVIGRYLSKVFLWSSFNICLV